MNKEQVLYATKKGEPDYMEDILTTNPAQFDKAKAWAEKNGYDRIHIVIIDLNIVPDFTKAIQI